MHGFNKYCNSSSSSSSWVYCPREGISLQTQAPRLQFCPKGRSSPANSGTKVAVLLWMNRCGSIPLPSAPHSLSLFSIQTDLKRIENILGAPWWRWGEWIWLTGSSGLHRTSPYGHKYQFHQGFWSNQRSGNPNRPSFHIFYVRRMKFLQAIYEIFDCDLTQGFKIWNIKNYKHF